MHSYVVALKETAVISVAKWLSINVLYLAAVQTVSLSGCAMTRRSQRDRKAKVSVVEDCEGYFPRVTVP